MPPSDRRNETTVGADGLRIWSCVICRRRKVRCDRREPCANCVRNDIDCHYPVTGRLPRRREPPATGQSSKPGKHSELIQRLRRLEAVVTELSAQVQEGTGDVGLSEATSWQISLPEQDVPGAGDRAAKETDTNLSSDDATAIGGQSTHAKFVDPQEGDGLDEDFGSLVVAQNGVVQVGNRFWTIFCDEVHNIFEAVDDIDQTENETTTASASKDMSVSHDFLFGASAGIGTTNSLEFLTIHLPFLWQSFVTNVDPFIKILHLPSMSNKVQAAVNSLHHTPVEDQALLLAMSLAAIVSLDDDAVTSRYGLPKQKVVVQYRESLERTFSLSQLVTSRNMALLQAFVIYLSVLPYVGSSDEVWPLIGLLLRMATRLGLHRDASHTAKLSVLKGELRRRLWWQICLIDSRSRDGSVPQLSASEGMFDTTKPANIDDEELDSMTTNFDIGSERITSMTLFLIRCDLWRLSRSMEQSRDQTLQTHLTMVRTARRLIESTYLQKSDLDKPLDSFVSAATSLFFAKIESMLYGRAAKQASTSKINGANVSSEATRHASKQLLRCSSEVITIVANLLTSPSWHAWKWQLRGQVPWLAMGFVLEDMAGSQWNTEKEKLWQSLQQLDAGISGYGIDAGVQKKLQDLMTKARLHREAWLPNSWLTPQAETSGDQTYMTDGDFSPNESERNVKGDSFETLNGFSLYLMEGELPAVGAMFETLDPGFW